MKNNRKIEVGQVRNWSSCRSDDYDAELYVICNIDYEKSLVSVKYLKGGSKQYYTYKLEYVVEDIVVM